MYTLQQTVNWARTFIQYSPLTAGFGGEPTVSIANTVLSTMTSAPFTWGWNRAEYGGLVLKKGKQDYDDIAVTDFGFLEKVSAQKLDGSYGYEIKDVYNTNALGVSAPGSSGALAQPKSVSVKMVNYGKDLSLRFLSIPDQDYNSVLTYQKLITPFPASISAQSQQTGSGIPVASALKVGSVLKFNDGVTSFTYTSVTTDTLGTLVAAVNATTAFKASTSGVSLILISSVSGYAVNIVTNTLTDLATGLLAETFAGSAVPFLMTTPWPVPDQYLDIYNNLFLAEAFQAQMDEQSAMKYRMRGVAALLSKAEGLTEMQRNAFLSQYLIRDSQAQASAARTQQASQARGM